MPNQIENFLDDILDCFDKELKNEIKKVGGNYKGSPLTWLYYITNLIKKSINFIKQRSKNETNQ